jgi:hypothetical protein
MLMRILRGTTGVLIPAELVKLEVHRREERGRTLNLPELVSDNHLVEAKTVIGARMTSFIQYKQFREGELAEILWTWHSLVGSDQVREALNFRITTKAGAMNTVVGLLGMKHTSHGASHTMTTESTFPRKDAAEMLDIVALDAQLDPLLAGELPEDLSHHSPEYSKALDAYARSKAAMQNSPPTEESSG